MVTVAVRIQFLVGWAWLVTQQRWRWRTWFWVLLVPLLRLMWAIWSSSPGWGTTAQAKIASAFSRWFLRKTLQILYIYNYLYNYVYTHIKYHANIQMHVMYEDMFLVSTPVRGHASLDVFWGRWGGRSSALPLIKGTGCKSCRIAKSHPKVVCPTILNYSLCGLIYISHEVHTISLGCACHSVMMMVLFYYPLAKFLWGFVWQHGQCWELIPSGSLHGRRLRAGGKPASSAWSIFVRVVQHVPGVCAVHAGWLGWWAGTGVLGLVGVPTKMCIKKHCLKSGPNYKHIKLNIMCVQCAAQCAVDFAYLQHVTSIIFR